MGFIWIFVCTFLSSEVRSPGGVAQLIGGGEKKQDDRVEDINMEYIQ